MPWLKLCATPRKRRQHVALQEHAVFIFDELLTRLFRVSRRTYSYLCPFLR